MLSSADQRGILPWLRTTLMLSMGALLGLLLLFVSELETKWQVYTAAGLFFCFLIVIAPNRKTWLWDLLVLSFQFEVSIRLLYGYAGSDGIAFPLTTFIGLCVLGSHLLSKDDDDSPRLAWRGKLFPYILAFLATSALTVVTTAERFIVVSSLIGLLQYYLLYLLAFNFIRTEKQLSRTVNLLFIVLAVQSIIYFVQSSLGVTFNLVGDTRDPGVLPRPGGTVSSNPHGFGSFILPILFLATTNFIATKQKQSSVLYPGVVAMLGLGALVLTLTRAIWGGFILGVVLMIFIMYRRRLLSMRKMLAVSGVAVLISAAAMPMIMSRLEGSPLNSSYDERLALMKMAIRVIEANPVTGVGLGAYDTSYKSYLTSKLADEWQYRVHNYYLLRTAETGIVGGIAFIVLLVMAMRQTLRISRSSRFLISITGISWAAALIAECFEMYWDIWSTTTVYGLVWFMLGMMEAAEKIELREKNVCLEDVTKIQYPGLRAGAR